MSLCKQRENANGVLAGCRADILLVYPSIFKNYKKQSFPQTMIIGYKDITIIKTKKPRVSGLLK